MASLDECRKFYANYVVRMGGSEDTRLIDVFAKVPREDFLGPGPWSVFAGNSYLTTVDADPKCVYQDVLFGLMPEKVLNNGRPSTHTRCLAAAKPSLGETVLHIGVGTGYYTAILAELVGPDGRVIGFELESALADRARTYLRERPNVEVRNESANETRLPQADVIYVNAGATHPPAAWLDALRVGGRLILPLTGTQAWGVMLAITRADTDTWSASGLAPCVFTPCIGARDQVKAADALAAGSQRRPFQDIRSLRRNGVPDSTVWHSGDGWWLSTAEAG